MKSKATLSIIVALMLAGPVIAQRAASQRIKQGDSVQRTIARSQTETWLIGLAKGQFLEVAIHQRGIDVAATLFGPDGNQMAQSDRNAEHGREWILAVAQAPGDHRLTITAGKDSSPQGRYQIIVRDLRRAAEKDFARIAADRAVQEGEKLFEQQSAEATGKAIEKYESALPALRSAEDRQGEAIALNNLGEAYYSLSDYQRSLDCLKRALSLYEAEKDRDGEATALNNLGAVYDSLGEKQKSIDYYGKALAIFKSFGSIREQATLLDNIGYTYVTLGDYAKALYYYNQAVPLHLAAGDRVGQANSLGHLGSVYARLGDHRKALDHHTRALGLYRAEKDLEGEAITLSNLGVMHRESNQFRKALGYYSHALVIFRRLGYRQGIVITLSNVGGLHFALGETEQALDHYTQALALHREIEDRPGEAVTLTRMARVERSRGNYPEALKLTDSALSIIESDRAGMRGVDVREVYLASKQNDYELYIDLLMRMHRQQPTAGYDARAFEASERARARGLLDLIHESRVDIRQGVDAALLERERDLQKEINSTEKERLAAAAGGRSAGQDEAKKAIAELIIRLQETRAEIRAQSPRYAALTQPVPLTLKEVQSETLDQDTLLLEYSLGEERSFLWAVTGTSIHSFELPARAEIERQARRLYDLMTRSNRRVIQVQTEIAAAALSRMLIAPAAKLLGRKRLLIAGEGVLLFVPFAALPSPQASIVAGPSSVTDSTADKRRPLIADHEIIFLPSASVVSVFRSEVKGRQRASRSVAVFADPVLGSNDERLNRGPITARRKPGRLPVVNIERSALTQDLIRSARESGAKFARLTFTREEAEAIVSLVRDGFKAIDFDASRESVTASRLAEYRIIHFATHGIINSRHPELSGIVLSLVDEEGKPKDGFLRVHDIYNLKLSADLVVLSACQTALGQEIRGEGLIGLVRAFMYAGAPRVVASLWNVNDRATAELMKRFYKKMLVEGLRPSAALRAAQASMLEENQWADPYYWAAFTIQGEWKH